MAGTRDARGRWIDGPPAGTQRASRPKSTLAARLRETLTPERASQLFEDTWAEAVRRGSPRAMVEILQVWLSYAYGKPRETLRLESDATDLLSELLLSASSTALPLPPRQRVQVIDGESPVPAALPAPDADGSGSTQE